MEMPNSFRSANKQLLASDDWRAMKFDGSIDRLSSIPGFGSESLSEIVDSFRLPENAQMGNYSCAQGLPSSMEHTADHYFRGKKRNKLDKCTGSPVNYDHTINQNYEAEKPKDGSTQNTKSSMERIYEKKQKNEVDSSSQGNSNAPNKDYIHIRAKRGQATNSHSLAERVRREKISERMKLLQDIVPGCNKITGKAVMLDEIINYVQSLQKQVEFLSMKLATVTPEINIGMEKKFAKENMHSRYENSTYNGHLQEMVIPDVRLQSRMEILSAYNNMDFLRTANNYQLPDLSQVPNAWDNHSSGLQF